MRRYPEYKESKESSVEWIGEVPKNWEVKRLKYVADLNMGQSPPSEEYNSDQLGTPFLQGNAEFGPYHPMPKIYCPTAKKHANPGDILLSVRAPVGAINIANQEYGIGRGLCAIRPRTNQFERRYAKYLLEVVRTELHVVATGSTYEAVTVDEVSNLTCIVPRLSEQIQIANFLDRKTEQIDELIRIKERRIELLQEQRTALINQAVTKGLDPNVEMKPSGVEWIGELPKNWEVKKIKNTQSYLVGGIWGNEPEGNENDIYCIRVADFNYEQLTISTHNLTVRNIPLKKIDKRIIRTDDLLIEKSGGGEKSPVGKTVMFNVEIPRQSVTSNFITKFTAKSDSCFPKYLLYCLCFFYHIGLTRKHIKQTTGIQNLDINSYFQERIPLPSLVEQAQIANFLDHKTKQIDELISAEQRKIELLKEYRQSLISEAVTGKIDVRNEV